MIHSPRTLRHSLRVSARVTGSHGRPAWPAPSTGLHGWAAERSLLLKEDGSHMKPRETDDMVKGVQIALVDGEPKLVFWRIEDFLRALNARRDTGLPLTSPKRVWDEIHDRFWHLLKDPEFREEPE